MDFGCDTGMTLLDMGMVDQELLAEARRLAHEQHQPVFKVLRDKLDMDRDRPWRALLLRA